jgi:hypothetical protein
MYQACAEQLWAIHAEVDRWCERHTSNDGDHLAATCLLPLFLSAADILGIAGGGSNPVLKLRSDWYLESVQVLHPFQSSAAYFFFHNGWLKHKRDQKDVRCPRCLFVACLHGAAIVYVWKNQSHLDAFGHAHITLAS